MTQFGRTIVELTGFDGAPGVNVFNWCAPLHADIDISDAEDFAEDLNDCFEAVTADAWAAGVRWTIKPDFGIHEVDTGELVGGGVISGGPYTAVGSGSGAESRATQIGVRFLTADFRNGRRVQGRCFLGPSSSGNIGTDGLVTSTARTNFAAAFDAITDPLAARLIVWSRPKPGGVPGAYADVQSVQISAKPFSLTGRRD